MYICTAGSARTLFSFKFAIDTFLISIGLTQLNNSNKPKSKLIVVLCKSRGPLPCFLNILLLSNADVNIVVIRVVAHMFPYTRFLSSGFAW